MARLLITNSGMPPHAFDPARVSLHTGVPGRIPML